ncbi:UvrD-helicase domain-containing protein [Capnocytophaga canimorsus]|uniref:UvrD-helicase domain-containing protein n=1 Tax=Capnocytophaga canimorsus TaxID=28188 RepID=UPI00385B0022
METYENILYRRKLFDINHIIQISKGIVPNDKKSKPWEGLKHGEDLLKTEDDLACYIAAYGEMHKIKCYAALQNFPFDQLNEVIEIVDWGCGQGIASLCFLQALRERQKESIIRKITLIEPSEKALQRAVFNLNLYTQGQVNIEVFNEYFPSNNNVSENFNQLSFNSPITIHLFSNILDIVSIDLVRLFELIQKASKREKHFVLCIGPRNNNRIRIDHFCELFSPISFFSNIDNPNYGYTSDTKHPFTCYTKGFEFNKQGLNTNNNIIEKIRKQKYAIEDTYTDYDEKIVNYGVDDEWYSFYAKIRGWLTENDTLFVKPNINGDIVDMIIIRPNAGILLIGCIKDFFKEDDKSDILRKVDNIRDNLVDMYLEGFKEKMILNKDFQKVIKKVLYFCNYTTKEINEIFKGTEKNRNYNIIYGYDYDKNFLDNILPQNQLFIQDIYDNFIKLLGLNWHSYKEGVEINLTKEQKILSKNNRSQKIAGIAGCGKTQVLALRAVNAQTRSGKNILILLFNLTLVNYIKNRLADVRADFYWNKFYITSYHQFFKTQANNLMIKVKSIEPFDDENYFEEVKDRLPKFPTILIDEVQDYSQPWLRIIKKYFLEENGELIVFGDEKQNVYNKELDQQKQIIIPTVSGDWNRSLNKGFRFSNIKLRDLAVAFQKEFFINYPIDEAIAIDKMNFDKNLVEYICNIAIHPIVWIDQILKKYNLEENKFVILAPTHRYLRMIDYHYRRKLNKNVLTTFETQEVYDELKKRYGGDTSYFWNEIKKVRRNKKINFTNNFEGLKLSSIYSFKGWEAENIFLIIESPSDMETEKGEKIFDSPQLIYTAITRAKRNLFILNLGNDKYDLFFEKCKKNNIIS